MEFSKNKLSKRIDWVTVALTLGLAVFGVICIASATSVGFEEGQSLMLSLIHILHRQWIWIT